MLGALHFEFIPKQWASGLCQMHLFHQHDPNDPNARLECCRLLRPCVILASGGSMTLSKLFLPVDLPPQLLVDMQSKRFPRLAVAPLTSHRTHVLRVCSHCLMPSCVKCMQVSLHCTETRRVNAHVLARLSRDECYHAVHTMTSLHSAPRCVTEG